MFFGSFVIATNDIYRYYYETDDGIRQGTVPASNTIIYYTDEAPYLAIVTEKYHYYGERWFVYSESWTESMHYELHVPEGSVAVQFEFD